MKPIILMAVLCLCGCAQSQPPWDTAPMEYRCTMEQAKQVDFETATCNETQLFSDYCYGTAIMRNCSKIIGGQNVAKETP